MSESNPMPSPTPDTAMFAERRTRVRYQADLDALCRRTEAADEQAWPSRLVNISQGGIGLMIRRRFQSGTLLDVELITPTGHALRLLRVRVVHSTAFKDDEGASCWLLGCVFARELDDSDLGPLLGTDRPPGQEAPEE